MTEKTMPALRKTLPESTTLAAEEVSLPEPEKDDLLVRVHAAGICGSDIHIMRNEYPSRPPVTLGHEFSGVVEAVGPSVQGFAPGDRVVSMTAVKTCGACRYCRQGLLMLCSSRRSIGSGVDGAFTRYIKVPASLSFSVPEGVTLDEAVLCEPLACVVRGVIERGRVTAGDTVLISGPGIIGQLAQQTARSCGARTVVAGIAEDRSRLDLAKELGAWETITVDREDAAARSEELTCGRGYDAVFECAGAEASAELCLKTVMKTGYFGQLGLYGKPIRFDMDLALMKEVHITNSFASEWTSWEKALELLEQKQVRAAPLIGPVFKLRDWQQAFDAMISKAGFKILLTCE